jgi:hypothetical protein
MGSDAPAGQFEHAKYYSAGKLPYQVITADFNNDGNADLAIADWLSDQLVILLGNGDGTFQRATNYIDSWCWSLGGGRLQRRRQLRLGGGPS